MEKFIADFETTTGIRLSKEQATELALLDPTYPEFVQGLQSQGFVLLPSDPGSETIEQIKDKYRPMIAAWKRAQKLGVPYP